MHWPIPSSKCPLVAKGTRTLCVLCCWSIVIVETPNLLSTICYCTDGNLGSRFEPVRRYSWWIFPYCFTFRSGLFQSVLVCSLLCISESVYRAGLPSITRLLPGSSIRCGPSILNRKCTNQRITSREAASSGVADGGSKACRGGFRGLASTIAAIITCKSSSWTCYLGCYVPSPLRGKPWMFV